MSISQPVGDPFPYNVYHPTITGTSSTPWTIIPDTSSGSSTYTPCTLAPPIRTLKDVLGEDAAKFVFLPSLFQIGSGVERYSLPSYCYYLKIFHLLN